MQFASETELGRLVVTWLEKNGWDVYQEAFHADIVARKGGITWIIECKRSLTFGVVAQAWAWIEWKKHAHRVSIAVPDTEGTEEGKGRRLAYKVCRDHGVGVLTVRRHTWGDSVNQRVTPADHVPDADVHAIIAAACTEEAKTREAGSISKPLWTPFKQTVLDAYLFVLANPDCLINDLVAGIQHCYANKQNARSAILSSIKVGIFPYLAAHQDPETIVRGRPAWRIYVDPSVAGSVNLMDRRPAVPSVAVAA